MRGKSPPFKTQIPNKIIFEHRDVVARGQGDQIPPPRFAQAGPGRILEVRDRIYQLGMVLLEQRLEVIHNHSPLIAGDSDHLQAKGTEQFQRSGVSRFPPGRTIQAEEAGESPGTRLAASRR